MKNIGILSTGAYVPETILTNQELAGFVETSDAWIRAKTGICERRIAAPEQATSDLAVLAARTALSDAGIAADSLDLLVLATSTPDMIQPSTAAIVQGRLGATNACAFDIGAVCSGFVYALAVADGFLRSRKDCRTALVIGAETYSRILDWTDRTTCVYFGDGASAAVLGEVDEGAGILDFYLGTDGTKANVISFPAGGSRHPTSEETLAKGMHAFRMDGRAVWEFVEKVFPETLNELTRRCDCSVADIDWVIPHQANMVLIKHCLERVGLSPDRTHFTVDRYGNTSAASVGITLDEAVAVGKIAPGDLVALIGFGGGLTWGGALMRW